MRAFSWLAAAFAGTAAAQNFTNPILYEDYPYSDVFYNPPDSYFYLSAGNMGYSPGAPIMRSGDLVNWEPIGHAIPTLPWAGKYNLSGGNVYNKGTWQGAMRYRPSKKLWYWIGCIENSGTYIYTAQSVLGPWTAASGIETCYIDPGLLIDDDDTMYVVHGSGRIFVSTLTEDGLNERATRFIFSTPSGYDKIEGNRVFKRGGKYYITNEHPRDVAFVYQSQGDIFGKWTGKYLTRNLTSPVAGALPIHQGSFVETPRGAWYYFAFTWKFPAGRLSVLSPVEWDSEGWPYLPKPNNTFGDTFPMPMPTKTTPSWKTTENFFGPELGPRWEWNANPDRDGYRVLNGLTLWTRTVTPDLFYARNTVTTREHGPNPTATVMMDYTNMTDGDRAGLAAFRDWTGYVGVVREAGIYNVLVVSNARTVLYPNGNFQSIATGLRTGLVTLPGPGRVWLRGIMDINARTATFAYSLDGTKFTALGTRTDLNPDADFGMGQRWALYNWATSKLGGSVTFHSFRQEGPER